MRKTHKSRRTGGPRAAENTVTGPRAVYLHKDHHVQSRSGPVQRSRRGASLGAQQDSDLSAFAHGQLGDTGGAVCLFPHLSRVEGC
ncbi:hypothetical protein MUG91_G81n105 [Manis pentadactyla]|nr:hypothetical protein MUG91_G81n105 [Manis pentadactyla]